MDELFYILKVVLKRLPHYNFMIDEADAMNLNRETLSKEVHRYISFHSDTEMNNILESLEELFEEYTEIFSGRKNNKGISVFEAVFWFADRMLVVKNNEVLVRYENILRWRMMVQDLGEEIFVTAFRAKRDLNQGRYCKDFTWPVVIGHNNTQLRNVTRRGMAENHFHLWGSAPYFHISWIWIMNHVEECERSDAFKWVGDNARTVYMLDGREEFEGDLKKICLQAALIRVYLYSLLTEQEINIGKYYVEYQAILPWIQEIEDADSAPVKEFSNIYDVFQYVEEREELRKYAFTLRSIFKKQIDIPINIGNKGLRSVLEYALEKEKKIDLRKCRRIFSKEEYHRLWEQKTREKVLFYLKDYEMMRWHIDEIQRAIADMNCKQIQYDNVDYMLNYVQNREALGENYNYILAGERKFLYDMFRYVEKGSLKYDSILYNWFYVYLSIKEKMRGEMVQSNEWVGFKNFSIYQNRSGSFAKEQFLEKAKAHMAVASCFEQNIVKLEVRFSPYYNTRRLCREIRFLDAAIDPEGRFRNNYYYVLHFIKKQDTENIDTIYCNFRHAKLRREVRRKALTILKLREEYTDVASRVLGIDGAAQEIGCRPEVFAQAFRTLHEDTGFRYTENGDERIPQLRITYHVGEDFLDLTDGLRAIDEAILFLNMDCGDRIGHALALGVDVKKWYKSKEYHISLAKQDYLDNIVWLYHAIVRYNIEGQDNLKNWLETEYRKFFEEIYARHMDRDYIEAIQTRMGKKGHKGNMNFDIHDYYDSWKIRGDAPELYRKGYYYNDNGHMSPYEINAVNKIFPEEFAVRKRSEVAILYHFYHYNSEVRREGKKKIDRKMSMQYVKGVELVQKAMQWEIAQRGIAIETNPSSNFMIGTFSRYEEHPITTFFNEGLTLDYQKLQDSAQMWVSINTDDQGVFDIKLENEYALIARALEKQVDKSGKPVYPKMMIYNWLDKIRRMGLDQSFLISQQSVYEEGEEK